MDRKELNAINQLFDRLDKSLAWNAALLGRRNPTPDMENVDELGKLFERHRYLKNDHDFAPGEAEALLGFSDPLAVAQSCWEENSFINNFPICEILNDIGAYDRFTLTKAEQERRKGPQVQLLKERLDQNLAAYTAALMGKSKSELIEDCEKITSTQAAYSYMRCSYEYTHNDADLLLKLDDPLHYLASRWSMSFDLSGDDDDTIQEIIEELEDPRNLHDAQEAAATLVQTEQEADQPPTETLDWGPAVDQETKKLLMERLDQNYTAYTASLAGMSRQELIEKSIEIASVQDAYSFLKNSFEFTQAEGEHLLKMEGPLFFFAHVWIAPADWRDDADSFTHEIMRDLDSPEYLAEMAAAYPGFTAEKDSKPSLLDRLHRTEKVAGQRPPQEDRLHRKSDAPNL